MNIEIMRNTLYKAYLDDFARYCHTLGGATAEIMADLLAFEVCLRCFYYLNLLSPNERLVASMYLPLFFIACSPTVFSWIQCIACVLRKMSASCLQECGSELTSLWVSIEACLWRGTGF